MPDLRNEVKSLQIHLGDMLKAARDAAHIDQESAADDAGVGQGTLSKIEAGTRLPSLDTALRLAKAVEADAETVERIVIRARLYRELAKVERNMDPERLARAAIDLAVTTGKSRDQLVALLESWSGA